MEKSRNERPEQAKEFETLLNSGAGKAHKYFCAHPEEGSWFLGLLVIGASAWGVQGIKHHDNQNLNILMNNLRGLQKNALKAELNVKTIRVL